MNEKMNEKELLYLNSVTRSHTTSSSVNQQVKSFYIKLVSQLYKYLYSKPVLVNGLPLAIFINLAKTQQRAMNFVEQYEHAAYIYQSLVAYAQMWLKYALNQNVLKIEQDLASFQRSEDVYTWDGVFVRLPQKDKHFILVQGVKFFIDFEVNQDLKKIYNGKIQVASFESELYLKDLSNLWELVENILKLKYEFQTNSVKNS